MVNVWESVNAGAEARDFCDIWGIENPVLLDESGDYIAGVSVRGVPYNFVVDETGTVVGAGLTHPEELVEFLERTGMLAPETPE